MRGYYQDSAGGSLHLLHSRRTLSSAFLLTFCANFDFESFRCCLFFFGGVFCSKNNCSQSIPSFEILAGCFVDVLKFSSVMGKHTHIENKCTKTKNKFQSFLLGITV